MKEMTTIPLSKNTREILKGFGRKGETYDSIILRLISEVGWTEYLEEQVRKLEDRSKFIPLDEID